MKRAIERDALAIAQWVKKDWPRQQQAVRHRAQIVVIGKAGFLILPFVHRSW